MDERASGQKARKPAAGRRRRTAFALALAVLVAGCASGSLAPNWRRAPSYHAGAEAAACLEDFRSFDKAVRRAGVRDREAARIRGFPYLRVNRLLASFRQDDLTAQPARFADWVTALRRLDREGRWVEAANLARHGIAAPSLTRLDHCAEVLRRSDFARAEGRTALVRAAYAPPSYTPWKRIAGLYPVTALGVSFGYRGWKKETLATFAQAPQALPVTGRLKAYEPPPAPLSSSEVAALLASARRDSLGLPAFTAAERRALLLTFAPVWQIDEAGAFDRPGRPLWDGPGPEARIIVDPSQVPVFGRLAWTRYQGRLLTQLVYVIWFPERPRTGRFDLLGGSLDGVVWRVTLGPGGQPLIYDSMHPCGCYHLFFPVPPLARKPMAEDQDARESPLVPLPAPVLAAGARLVVRLASATHYVSALFEAGSGPQPQERVAYDLRLGRTVPDQDLRLAPIRGGAGTRSLYGEDGIIRQSARLERLTLWPMGIDSPGAMRQWGTHATAFVGTRHFDDPFLIEDAFQ